jgi:hypothetical protein
MKQGNLFCFVLSGWDLRNQPLCFWYLEKALDECIDLVWDCLELRWRSYLIVEPFSQWKLNKIKTENCIKIWGHSCCCWKALDKSDWMESNSQFSELRCGRYYCRSGFCCWKFKHIAKIGFERKSQLSTQFVHTWVIGTCYTSIAERRTTVAKAYGIKVKWVSIGNSICFDPWKKKREGKKSLQENSTVHYPSGKWTRDSPPFTPNTTRKKNSPCHSPLTHKKKREAPSLHDTWLLIGCKAIIFLKLAATIFGHD